MPAPPGTAQVPAQVIDLANWYLTLPTGEKTNPTRSISPSSTPSATPVPPRRHPDRRGLHRQRGRRDHQESTYPRSELREMTGAEKASWSNTTGNHVLRLRQAITRLPTVKPQVVTAQIHDAEDDVIEVRLEGSGAGGQYDNGSDKITLDPAYVLDTPYDLEIARPTGTSGCPTTPPRRPTSHQRLRLVFQDRQLHPIQPVPGRHPRRGRPSRALRADRAAHALTRKRWGITLGKTPALRS